MEAFDLIKIAKLTSYFGTLLINGGFKKIINLV